MGIGGGGDVARLGVAGADGRGRGAEAARGRGLGGGTFKLTLGRAAWGGGPGGGLYVGCGRC